MGGIKDLKTIKLKEEPELLGPCPNCKVGLVTDIDQGMIHCSLCGEYYYELEE